MNNYIVYKHICPNNKVYIGITKQNINNRWNYGNGYKSCTLFFRAIKKYGWKNIQHEILFEHLTKEEAEQKEIELIAYYKSNQKEYGYNICSGGNGTPSHIVNEKTKNKISNSTKKAMNNPIIKEKIINAHLGKKLSNEQKNKISLSNKGRKLSEETKEKQRKNNINNKRILCIETNEEYISYHEAERITGIAFQNIYKVCKGYRERAGGFHWKEL